MPAETAHKNADFILPQIINIQNIEILCMELKERLKERRGDFVLDVGQVENITIPGLQLIVSIEKTLSAAGGSLTMRGDSPYFTSTCRDAGLSNLLTVEQANG